LKPFAKRSHQFWITSMPNLLQPTVALTAQFVDLAIETPNNIHGPLDGGCEFVRLTLPSTNPVHFGCSSTHLCINLVAKLAPGASSECLHDQFHATCLPDSVFLGTVLAEMAPFPIATRESVLVIKAHVSG
jgi:hypothetical protein